MFKKSIMFVKFNGVMQMKQQVRRWLLVIGLLLALVISCGRTQADIVSYNQSHVLMLDVARRHMSATDIEAILNNVDAKTFPIVQLHLNDNEGFAVQISMLHNQGWLSAIDIQQINQIAQQRGIILVPDMDVPSHCGSLIQQLKQAGYNDDSLYMDDETLDYTNHETISLVKIIDQQIANLFLDRTAFVIGADEVPGNVACATNLAAFINQISENLHQLGYQQTVVWNDSINDNVKSMLDSNITINDWNDHQVSTWLQDGWKVKNCYQDDANLNIGDLNDTDYVADRAQNWKQKQMTMLCFWGDGQGDHGASNQQIIDAIKQFE